MTMERVAVIARSNATKQSRVLTRWQSGLLRVARNDVERVERMQPCANCLSCIFPLALSGKSQRCFRPSRAHKRGARDRHGRWERDAMDAACCQTNDMTRTVKSCGPDAPGLASSWR